VHAWHAWMMNDMHGWCMTCMDATMSNYIVTLKKDLILQLIFYFFFSQLLLFNFFSLNSSLFSFSFISLSSLIGLFYYLFSITFYVYVSLSSQFITITTCLFWYSSNIFFLYLYIFFFFPYSLPVIINIKLLTKNSSSHCWVDKIIFALS